MLNKELKANNPVTSNVLSEYSIRGQKYVTKVLGPLTYYKFLYAGCACMGVVCIVYLAKCILAHTQNPPLLSDAQVTLSRTQATLEAELAQEQKYAEFKLIRERELAEENRQEAIKVQMRSAQVQKPNKPIVQKLQVPQASQNTLHKTKAAARKDISVIKDAIRTLEESQPTRERDHARLLKAYKMDPVYDALGGLRSDHVPLYSIVDGKVPTLQQQARLSQIIDETLLASRNASGKFCEVQTLPTSKRQDFEQNVYLFHRRSIYTQTLWPSRFQLTALQGSFKEALARIRGCHIDLRPFKDLSVESINKLSPDEAERILQQMNSMMPSQHLKFAKVRTKQAVISANERLILKCIELTTYIYLGATPVLSSSKS